MIHIAAQKALLSKWVDAPQDIDEDQYSDRYKK